MTELTNVSKREVRTKLLIETGKDYSIVKNIFRGVFTDTYLKIITKKSLSLENENKNLKEECSKLQKNCTIYSKKSKNQTLKIQELESHVLKVSFKFIFLCLL